MGLGLVDTEGAEGFVGQGCLLWSGCYLIDYPRIAAMDGGFDWEVLLQSAFPAYRVAHENHHFSGLFR